MSRANPPQAPISVLHRAISQLQAPFFCNFVSLEPPHLFVSQSPAGSAARPGTRYCKFEASEPIPFPGADLHSFKPLRNHFRATPFSNPNGCRLQIASPHSVLQVASKRPRPPPRIGEA